MIQLTGFSGFSDAGPATADAPGRFADIFSNIISIMTIFSGLAFMIWFIIGAFTWITGGHDPAQLDKAKQQMSSAIIGLVATVAVIPIVYIVSKLTGIAILNPESIILNILPN